MSAHLQFSCLVLALCYLSASADVFRSIDCGSTNSYKDENLIDWTGDNDYIHTGESHSVGPNNSISRVMDTLRAFTTRTKNCYNIDSVKQGRVLVRASFYYGNYDNKSTPPTFDLHFEGNYWATVKTSSTEYVFHEVIYVMKKDSISVCVAQTSPGQFPFISALEVRGLESYMYMNVNITFPLFLRKRVTFGSNATVRYPDDLYDRVWIPEVSRNGTIPVTNEARFGSPIIVSDLPPPAVLKHAVTTVSPKFSSIELFMGFPSVEVPVYVNAYFSEVAKVGPTETRSLSVWKDNKPFSQPFIPPFENCTELYTSDITASTNTTFSIVAANDSTLPPIINAMEVFVIGKELTNGTNKQDVQGLGSLQRAFGMLGDWSGDPCLPTPYTWDWINCSTDPTPRVTALLLGNFGLSGMLPNFSSMNALQTIDLHNNTLEGPIPDFLGTFSNLRTLNLANNRFNGSIPASLSTKNRLDLVVAGNPDLCTSRTLCPASSNNPGPGSSGTKTRNSSILPILFGTIIQSIVILLHLMDNL
ncbi:hypothetical protein CASFOL_035549 [Castilleja foliolosa]|uniref:Malectin-like domain-containing protein n=1 Tax=Castilleja foliolosa TaxID=1961234 RepID=A0ABD3BTM5_9LAMI